MQFINNFPVINFVNSCAIVVGRAEADVYKFVLIKEKLPS